MFVALELFTASTLAARRTDEIFFAIIDDFLINWFFGRMETFKVKKWQSVSESIHCSKLRQKIRPPPPLLLVLQLLFWFLQRTADYVLLYYVKFQWQGTERGCRKSLKKVKQQDFILIPCFPRNTLFSDQYEEDGPW